MPAPDYLTPALHAEYDRLTDMLTTPVRVRDATIIARALHEGYRRGHTDAIGELLTSEQVASELGISRITLTARAKRDGIGWRIGRDYLFQPGDIALLRRAKPGRPRTPPAA